MCADADPHPSSWSLLYVWTSLKSHQRLLVVLCSSSSSLLRSAKCCRHCPSFPLPAGGGGGLSAFLIVAPLRTPSIRHLSPLLLLFLHIFFVSRFPSHFPPFLFPPFRLFPTSHVFGFETAVLLIVLRKVAYVWTDKSVRHRMWTRLCLHYVFCARVVVVSAVTEIKGKKKQTAPGFFLSGTARDWETHDARAHLALR